MDGVPAPSKADMLAEAYRRGILPPDKAAMFEEAQRRGLFDAGSAPEAGTPEAAASDIVGAAAQHGAIVQPGQPAAQTGTPSPGPVADAEHAVRSAVTGEGRMDDPSLPEFKADGAPTSAALKITAGLIFGDPQQQADIVKNSLPGAKVSQDHHGNWIAEWNGQKGYLNKPGLTERDVGQAMGQGLEYAAALTPAGRIASLLPRAAAMAGSAGLASLGTDAALRNVGSDQPVGYKKAGLTAAAAGFGEIGGSVASGVLQKLAGKTAVVDASGQLTPAATKALQDAKIDPANVSPDLIASFQQQAKRANGVDPATARAAAAGEFGIPLTKGQATQDVGQIAEEEAMRNNARGDLPGNIVRGFDQKQRTAVADARDKIATTVAGGQSLAATPGEAGERVATGLKTRAQAARDAVDQAYDTATTASKNTMIGADLFKDLPGRVGKALDDNDIIVDHLTPATAGALNSIDDFANFKEAQLGPDESVAGVSLRGLEQLRRRVGGRFAQSANPVDRRALTITKNTLDDFIDEAVDKGLMSGDPAALDALKGARQLRAAYSKKFAQQNPRDKAGQFIETVLQDPDPNPDYIANWLFGARTVGLKPESEKIAQRLKDVLGEDSPEWQAVREGAWRKLTETPGDKADLTPHMLAERIGSFLDGDGRTLSRRLYSPDELAQMRRFGRALRVLTPPKEATNPSKTSYGMARLMNGWMSNLAGAAGLASPGGFPAAVAAREAVAAAGAMKNTMKAGKAVSGVPAKTPRAPLPLTVLGAALGNQQGGR
jgi:hypothetical protein